MTVIDPRLPARAKEDLARALKATPPAFLSADAGGLLQLITMFEEMQGDPERAMSWFLAGVSAAQTLSEARCDTPELRERFVASFLRVLIVQSLNLLFSEDREKAAAWVSTRPHLRGRCRCGASCCAPFPPERARRVRVVCARCGRKVNARIVRPEVN